MIACIPLWLCWGSFLNMLGYRLIDQSSFWAARSFCPVCKHSLAWYDLIPLVSWVRLSGKCRSCSHAISLLYPFIELLTAIVMSLLIAYISADYWFGYFLFFSALIVTIRTDLETMLISRYATLALIPLGFLLSGVGYVPVTPFDSITGALSAALLLYFVRALFFYWKRQQGLGQGDIELLAFIGPWLGMNGWWYTLLIGSLCGTLVGLGLMLCTRGTLQTKLPFGPFLALGAMFYVFYASQLA